MPVTTRKQGYNCASFLGLKLPRGSAVTIMKSCDTLITASWCVPVEPADTIMADCAVAITEGRIVDVLPSRDARAIYQPGVTVDRPGHVLIPGLVNAHTHAAMTLFRGLADDLPLETWLVKSIWPAEKRWVSAEFVRDGTKLAIAEMLRAGITSFSDQYFFPEIVAETAVDAHIRCMVGTPVVEFENAWAKNAAECLSKGSDLVHDQYADHPLVSSCFAPHSVGAVSDETFNDIRVLADQLDCSVQIHLHESRQEIEESLADNGMRPVARMAKLGLLNSSLLAVHSVHLNDEEIDAFADAAVSVAHCPRSNLKLADGFAPVASMQQKGINVALGTDGAASNNVLDILGEMRMAALLGKTVADDAEAISATQALSMATIEGARALGLSDCIGSIENGKWADLTCIDLNRLHSQPVYNVVSQLVYATNSEQVSDVWVAGRHLLDAGDLTHIDQTDVLQRAAEWRDRISISRNPSE
jgi:5-methylthioadenosine/S-adenosylhomocysteine deaminase